MLPRSGALPLPASIMCSLCLLQVSVCRKSFWKSLLWLCDDGGGSAEGGSVLGGQQGNGADCCGGDAAVSRDEEGAEPGDEALSGTG